MALIDDFLPALTFAALLGSDATLATTPYQTAREDMDRLLDQAMAKAQHAGNRYAEEALFAVCAFADEAILNSNWSERAHWLRPSLQQARFDQPNAGVEFFAHLERLNARLGPLTPPPAAVEPSDWETLERSMVSAASTGLAPTSPSVEVPPDDDPREAREVHEVYATCLVLGFKGAYFRESDRQRLAQLTSETIARLGLDAIAALDRLVPDVYGQKRLSASPRKQHRVMRSLLLAGVPVLLAVMVYYAYATRLNLFVNSWLKSLT
ncbi:DotU family type IV/VI secretion system protein [uncultured Thiodictyon sp.]|uniref:DotU family type IV/VI secretion system protein n=1 Tax=uncultured Thiodictyon sp. TaxID=1846217 RepID=UPI0025F3810B|nr:DotU family type IV/VI secretion system protein [uncultured Thiodictyon sp.]